MSLFRVKYLSFFFGLISIFSFFNIIYSYYFNFFLNLNTYYISLLISVVITLFFYRVKSNPKKVLYFSSSASYPLNLQTKKFYRLLDENDINFESTLGVPDYTYGWAKLTGEYLAQIAFKNYGIKSICYRPFSGYGEDQDMNYPFPNLCKNIYFI